MRYYAGSVRTCSSARQLSRTHLCSVWVVMTWRFFSLRNSGGAKTLSCCRAPTSAAWARSSLVEPRNALDGDVVALRRSARKDDLLRVGLDQISDCGGAVHAVRDPQAAEAEEQSDSPCLRAFSTTASDSQPYACVREWGLPKLQEIELSRQKQQLWQRQSARNRTG